MVEMESLGWRKGFKVTDEYSALGDDAITSRIAIRMHTLLRLIEGESPKPLVVKNTHLEDQVEELEDEVHSLTEKLKKANITIGKYEDSKEEEDDDIEELLILVNEALSEVYDEEFVDLAPAVEALVEEYNEAVEEAEDEG
jgi:hypothetical protein